MRTGSLSSAHKSCNRQLSRTAVCAITQLGYHHICSCQSALYHVLYPVSSPDAALETALAREQPPKSFNMAPTDVVLAGQQFIRRRFLRSDVPSNHQPLTFPPNFNSCYSAAMMLLPILSLAISLTFPALAAAEPVVILRQVASFDCGQVRVDSPNTTYSGFLAADLDAERRYVVTRTASQKRLLTRYENNTLFTLVGLNLRPSPSFAHPKRARNLKLTLTPRQTQNSNGKNPTFGATFGFYWDTPPGKPNFAPSAQNYAYFNSVAASKHGAKPANIAASINEAGTNPSTGGKRDHESESAIFELQETASGSTGDRELTAKWVNTDGCMCLLCFAPSHFLVV